MVLHQVLKLFFYLVFGIRYNYINPFTLTIHGLRIKNSNIGDVLVKIGKIKLLVSIFRKKKSLVELSISDVICDLTRINDSRIRNNENNQSNSMSDSIKSNLYSTDGSTPQSFDPDAQVVIYPDNKKLKRLLKFLIKIFPHLTFIVRQTEIKITSQFSIICSKTIGKIDIDGNVVNPSILEKNKISNHIWLTSVQVIRCYLYNNSTNQTLLNFLNRGECMLRVQLDLENGIVSDIQPSISLVEIDTSIIYLLKLLKSFSPGFKFERPDHSQTKEVKIISKSKLYLYGFVFRLLKKASISIRTVSITDIPITTKEKLNYFLTDPDALGSLDDILFVSAKFNSISLDIGPVNQNQVGYSLKYVEGSYPLQWIFSYSSLNLSMNFTKIKNYTGKTKIFDVLSVPNFLFTVESTMMVNLLRVVFNNSVEENFTRKQTITTGQLSIANPSIDMSAEQLSILIHALSDIQNEMANTSRMDNIDEQIIEDNCKKKKLYIDVLLNTSPTYFFKVFIEKPLIIIRSENELSDGKDIHLSTFQPSMTNVQLDITTTKKVIDVSFRFDIPEISMIYQRNNLNASAVKFFTMRDLQLKICFQIMEFKNLVILFKLGGLSVHLSDLGVINGLSIVINTLKHFLVGNKISIKNNEKKETVTNFGGLFNDLPLWFKNINILLGDIVFSIGSKSLFIAAKDLLDESNEHNLFVDNKVHTPSKVTYKIKSIDLFLHNPHLNTEVDDSTSSGNSETSKDTDDLYWFIGGKITNMQLQTKMFHNSLNVNTAEKLLRIPQFETNLYCLKTKRFELVNHINNIDISHSIASHFTLFSSFYLIKNAIKHHSRINSIPVVAIPQTTSRNSLISNLLDIKCFIKDTKFKMVMPRNFQVSLHIIDLKWEWFKNKIVIDNQLAKLYVKANPESNYFTRFITLENTRLVFRLPVANDQSLKLSLTNRNTGITVPSNFLVHSFFDAIVLTKKLTKKFTDSLKFGPHEGLDKVVASGIINLPTIKIKSDIMGFTIDDDPFETELAMIYQLGIVEQNSRLKKYKYFEDFLENVKKESINTIKNNENLIIFNRLLDELMINPTMFTKVVDEPQLQELITACSKRLHKLRVNISKSWIILIKEFKMKRKNIVQSNLNSLSELLSNVNSSTMNFIDFNDAPPLVGLLFNDFILTITPPIFTKDSNDVHQFLYRVGKGVPKDTNWDKIIPMHITIKTSEFRVHLRDFPLPLIYIPNYQSNERWSNSFILSSTFVISEPMPVSDRQYTYLWIPMFDGIEYNDKNSKFYSWNAPKTVTTVKSFYEIDLDIRSDNSTMVTWSAGYQAVLRQLNISFDGFSKPTNDPSPKLGIWDKMRNIIHGYIKINWINPNSEVSINILNSADPYNIVGASAGFSLVMKDDVQWVINDPDREFERDYFIFKSKSLMFGIPNYLCHPLPCWCSKELIFLPLYKGYTAFYSLYGYYLNSELYLKKNLINESIFDAVTNSKFKTHNIFLNGDIEIKLAMSFERKLPDGSKTTEFKSHFENILTSAIHVANKENFDSYRGFRSDYIHMALQLSAKNSTYNTVRLTPRSITHFLSWFGQFSGDIGLPIRSGSLWSAKENSVKLGLHLMTFKYSFDVEPLYIYHGHRNDWAKPDNCSLIGLKGKIHNFKCDLHQRKEKRVKHVDFLNQSSEVLKLAFCIGKLEFNDIDLRVIGLNFNKVHDGAFPHHSFEIFDDDQDWIDIMDYEEVDIPSLKNADIHGQIYPLLYAYKFCYWMHKNIENGEFGFELSHSCSINADQFPDSTFNHIFDTDGLKFKWFPFVRNLLFEYLAAIEFRHAFLNSSSSSAIASISRKLDETLDQEHTINFGETFEMSGYNIATEDEFEKAMRNIVGFLESTVPVDHMLLRFNDVQLQLMLDPTAEHLILFRVQHTEIELIELMDQDWYRYVKSVTLSKRYGTIFKDADLLIITQKDYKKLGKTNIHYGTCSAWPVFLDGDEPEEYIKNKTLLSEVLIYLIIENTSNTYVGGKRRDKLYVNIPTFETKIDSESYQTFFETFQQLLIYASPEQKRFAETTEALALSTADMNKRVLIKSLEASAKELKQLLNIYQCMAPLRCVSEQTKLDAILRHKSSKLFSNVLLVSKLALASCYPVGGEDDDNCFMEWIIKAAKINIDLVVDGHPFLNFTMNDCTFSRMEMLDDSTINEIVINNIQILNKDYNILYPELLVTYNDDLCCGPTFTKSDSMIRINWELGEKVGGMHNIRNVEIKCHPMQLSMEDSTGLKLMHFLFPEEMQFKESKNGANSDNDDVYSSDSKSEYDENSDTDNDDGNKTIDEGEEEAEVPVPVNKLLADRVYDSSIDGRALTMEAPLWNIHKKKNLSLSYSKEKGSMNGSRNESHVSSEYFYSSDVDSDDLNFQNLFSPDQIKSPVSSQFSKDSSAKSSIVSTYSKRLNKSIVDGRLLNTASAVENLTKYSLKNRGTTLSSKSVDITEISERAKVYFTIRRFVFNNMLLNVTFNGKGKLRLINVNKLTLLVPTFKIKKKIWTGVDMINAIKKHIIKTLLKQTGRLLKNKILIHKRKRRVNKLKSISNE